MGREIERTEFSAEDFSQFKHHLHEETRYLCECLENQRVEASTGTCGLELEGCLLDENYRPAPANEAFINQLGDPLVVPELAKFNFEINTPPFAPESSLFSAVDEQLASQWQACRSQARKMGLDVCQVGILPSLRDEDLTLSNLSSQQRYLALNNQILKGRKYRPLNISIAGEHDTLDLQHRDVMIEAATTSLQVHLQVAPADFSRYYNASLLASALTVAACANSPLVFGNVLWAESRIPLFEQAVAVPCFISGETIIHRVCFGSGFARASAAELFLENEKGFPVLLPTHYNATESLPHLQLHNGTIWRWNRPLIHLNAAGQLQLRLEHRAMPSGPTIIDDVANIALYYGLVSYLAETYPQLPAHIDFDNVYQNFYAAARWGLDAMITWPEKGRTSVQDILLQLLLPACQKQLEKLGFDKSDIHYYIGEVIGERICSGQTGACWQQCYFESHNRNLHALMEAYQHNADRGAVYSWE